MFGTVMSTRVEKYDYIEDAFEDYKETLEAADRSVVISPYLIEKAKEDFDFLKDDDVDDTYSVDEFNNIVLEFCKNAYNAQCYGCEDDI